MSLIKQWLDFANTETIGWRQRRALRQGFTPEVAKAIANTGDTFLAQSAERLFTHPYFSFEPREDDPINGDQQTSFYESRDWVSCVVGGNGSGKTYCAAQKVVDFLASTMPPTRDCPFWVISNSYEKACGACWAQKLSEIIPEDWIDWGRISWYRPNLNWPQVVPLKRWGKTKNNWLLDFKSYEQGREKMQATSIGGAWFSEQFPWEIWLEVNRGAREYGQPGSMVMEFTPIDPIKSIDIERIYRDWLKGENRDWGFYKLNTESAMKSGHVTEQWYNSFVGMISEEAAETRIRGAFARYEGVIYPKFTPTVHCQDIDIPEGVYHYAGIDWGAGEENAFVFLWCYVDSLGQYVIYDEYYSTEPILWEEHIENILDKHPWPSADENAYYKTVYAPPDRPDCARIFMSHGFPITTANTQVFPGIESVRQCLEVNEAIGEPMLIIDKERCPKLIEQLATYRWEKGSQNSLNPRDARPQPLKKDDHAPDALRYIIHTHKTNIATVETKWIDRKQRKGLPRPLRLAMGE